ncbi:hypothetical protein [Escherichia coli]|nr:hypothetical protein [Escherichia coli]
MLRNRARRLDYKVMR